MKSFIRVIIASVLFSTTLQAGNFSVNPANSEILVDSKASPPHTVTSFVRKYQSDIQIDPDTLAVSSARFTFQLKDLDSEHEKRDKKMNSWIESDKFPEIVFEMSDVSIIDGQNVAKSSLSMHGISKSVNVPFDVSKNGDTISIDGSADFSYEDWGLEIIRLFIFKVKPELNVRFHLEGTLQES